MVEDEFLIKIRLVASLAAPCLHGSVVNFFSVFSGSSGSSRNEETLT